MFIKVIAYNWDKLGFGATLNMIFSVTNSNCLA